MEQVVPPYNRDRVSEEFRQLADLADAMFRANLRNLSADPDGVVAHDELLARSSLYGYLYDRHFLHSPELLLNELRWLRSTHRPEAPRNAIHPKRFVEHRSALLELLIRRFQNGLDYRDDLDPPLAPTAAKPAIAAKTPAASPHGTVRQSSDPDPERD
jgi:hypothetical protein